MRLKLLFLIFTLASLIISCADILLEGTSDDVSTSEIVGFWFACEFGSADIDCRFFDDDGLEFTNDGSVYEIEAYIYPPDPGCGSSACFDSHRPTISIFRKYVGRYVYTDSSLTFNIETDTSCTENLDWNTDDSFFRDSLSLCQSWHPYSFLYFKRYSGSVSIIDDLF